MSQQQQQQQQHKQNPTNTILKPLQHNPDKNLLLTSCTSPNPINIHRQPDKRPANRTFMPDLIIDQNKCSQYIKREISHFSEQYSKIVSLVSGILDGDGGIGNASGGGGAGMQFMSYQKFWMTNEGLERQLEQHLRELKNIDTVIDNIVNQQFDKCNQIDQIQQTIRIILHKKQQNHITKAQPFYTKKQQCLAYLTDKKHQKQKIKQQKLSLIKKILDLLSNLKRHRESGLRMCTVEEKDRKNEENCIILLERVINDFREIGRNYGIVGGYQGQLGELTGFIIQVQKQIQQYSTVLLELLTQQNQAYSEYQSIAKLKHQTEYFQSTLFSMFGISPSQQKRSSKKEHQNELHQMLTKLQKSLKQNKQKQKQYLKIEQGIETTKKTIGIFQHILSKIQTENTRKKLLLKDIEKLQARHFQQEKNLSTIAESENQIEKLKLRKMQLTKTLESKVDQANVKAYKTVHEEIQKIQTEIKIKQKQIQNYRLNLRQNAKKLYDDTMALQSEYDDILTEIVPSVLGQASQFTKEEAVKELNLYLGKVFKRLSIVD